MRFLANENLPRIAVEALRAAGHDVAWVRTEAPGARDEAVIEWGRRHDRVLLTFDKDFGDLVLRRGSAASSGVILFRLPAGPPAEVSDRILAAVSSRNDWPGHFSVVEEKRVRMRALPAGGTSKGES
jgi:predicted nuclease of predicted toxin-antitoxin system